MEPRLNRHRKDKPMAKKLLHICSEDDIDEVLMIVPADYDRDFALSEAEGYIKGMSYIKAVLDVSAAVGNSDDTVSTYRVYVG
jgi:hypothetical protein